MISSEKNPLIKRIRKLLNSSKTRKEEAVYILENETHILECIHKHKHNIELIVTSSQNLLKQCQEENIPVLECTETIIKTVSHYCHNAVAIIKRPSLLPIQHKPDLSMAIYAIKTPSNCGAIIRNAVAFNCNTLFLLGHCCDPYHPESIRATAGHIHDIHIEQISKTQIVKHLEQFQTIIFDKHAKQSLKTIEKTVPICLVFGSETGFNGFPDHSFSCYSISHSATVDSLNIAVASGIALHEIYHQ